MIPSKQAQAIMDELWDAGAEGILVTDIAACRSELPTQTMAPVVGGHRLRWA